MKGTISNIVANGSFTSQYGELFNFLYTIDNVQYSMNHKTQDSPFAIGSELEYEVTAQATQQYPAKIKKVQPEGGFQQSNGQVSQAKKAPGNNRSFALSYSKDLVVSKAIDLQDMFALAERMDRWLSGEEAIGKSPVEPPVVAPPVPVPPVEQDHGDLPF